LVRRALLIDGGQSGSRGRYEPGGETVSAPGLARRGRDYGTLRALRRDDVDVVAAGLTGFDGDAGAVARALGAPVIVTNDAVTAYLGALGAVAGVVVVAGTGAIALACGGDGSWARADGYGSMLGDDGGGFWIGRRALALALRARDGRPDGSAELLARAESHFGERIVPAVYDAADPVAAVASFVPDVAAAARDGDPVARGLWTRAGRELARTAAAAAAQVRAPVCSWGGGLFAAGDLLLAPFEAELARLGLALRPPSGGPLDGAAVLLERPPLFQDLIVEAGAP
jgi:N-acetylglucosamine kinase-like BadF-type ATPase